MDAILQATDLKKRFKLSAKQQKLENSRRKFVDAVGGLSFSVNRGEIYGLLGPNGAGKTTTLRMLATLIRPDAGDALLEGRSIVKEPEEVRRRIGFLTSELKLEDYFSPSYLFDFFAQLHGLSPQARAARKAELFDTFGIGEFAGVKVANLSTGMKQKAALAISLAHKLTRALAQARKSGEIPYLRPDGKAQVTVEYDDDRPVRIEAVVISTQHAPEVTHEQIKRDMLEKIIRPVVPASLLDQNTKFFINPTGRFVVGGPQGDSGLTGRKIIVDSYGGYGHHGGGAFSGKDPSKVDRSAAYAMRHVAKNLVAAGLCRRCEVGVAYAIGVAKPVSVFVDSEGTGVIPDDKLAKIVEETFDLRPAAIIRRLNLKRPIYQQIAAYGHFGRDDLDLPWERLDMAEALKSAAARA